MTVVVAGEAATKLRHRTPEERRRARAAPPESRARATAYGEPTKIGTGQGATDSWSLVSDGTHRH
jgi:hypothetical protein